jgi:cystathionine beta-lyase
MTDEELQIFFVEQAKVGLNPGTMFGKTQGSGFMRMNIATPRSTVLQALANIKQALRSK